MNRTRSIERCRLIARRAMITLAMLMAASAAAEDFPGRNDQNPTPPTATGLLMANGIYNLTDPDYTPPTADDFDTIMGR